MLKYTTNAVLVSVILSAVVLSNFQSFTESVLIPVRRESLDPAGKYILEWQVAQNSGCIIFKVTCETLGYVGFGISPTGTMWEADIVIGWVASNGEPYFEDHHGVGPTKPTVDQSQDYDLLAASQNATHTTLTFVRLLDTGDDDDVVITENTTSIIWSYGPTDAKNYHGPNRGAVPINLVITE